MCRGHVFPGRGGVAAVPQIDRILREKHKFRRLSEAEMLEGGGFAHSVWDRYGS